MVMLYALLFIVYGLLVGCMAVRIVRVPESRFELERQASTDNKKAQSILAREDKIDDLRSLQQACATLLMVGVTLVSVLAFGWGIGIVVAFVLLLSYGAVARMSWLHRLVQPYYDRLEPKLLDLIDRAPQVFGVLRLPATDKQGDLELQSKEQLLHLIKESRGVVTAEQKALINHGLAFGDIRVEEVMTPRSAIDSVASTELLGPLVLDDLHKTGHSRFPVIDQDIDHVVGVLHIRNLLVLGSGKDTQTAEQAMEPRVFYINQSQTLDHALAAFLKSHHHLFIVVNEYRETVGLLSLEDVIETLLGREIVDEFDAHDDLRAVALRNPRANNKPTKRTDV